MEAALIDQLTSPFLEAGLLGALILIVLIFMYTQHRDHRKDRADNIKTIEGMNKSWIESEERRHSESIQVIKENSTQMSQLATLIQTIVK